MGRAQVTDRGRGPTWPLRSDGTVDQYHTGTALSLTALR